MLLNRSEVTRSDLIRFELIRISSKLHISFSAGIGKLSLKENGVGIENVIETPIQKRNLKEFSDYYLRGLKQNLHGFGQFFSLVKGLFWFQVAVSGLVALYLMTKFGFLAGIQLIILSLYLAIIVWFVSLCRQFVKLQTEKVENDIRTTIEYRSESTKMAEEILKKAEQKAENKITISGGNAVLALDGSTVSGVNQTITVEGEGELVKSLALLVSFCEEAGDSYALEMANKLTEEATKKPVDKGVIFDLWGKIIAALPQVASVVKISQGIKSLL